MPVPPKTSILGLGTLVQEVVVVPDTTLLVDGSVEGTIVVGRGGMVCNTLAVAAALGATATGIVACGNDPAGLELASVLAAENVIVEPIRTSATPVAMSMVSGTNRSLVIGHAGVREPQLTSVEVAAVWHRQKVKPDWVFLTLPALDSPAGYELASLAQAAGSSIAVTLASTSHVASRVDRLETLLHQTSLVFANAAEWEAVPTSCHIRCPVVVTAGPKPAAVIVGDTAVRTSPADTSVVDATGAGDAFAAGVLTFYRPGGSLPTLVTATRYGHAAASVIVAKLGSSALSVANELRKLGATQY